MEPRSIKKAHYIQSIVGSSIHIHHPVIGFSEAFSD